MGLVDIRIPASSVGWVSKAVDFYLAGLGLVLEEGLCEVPRGELQLFSDHTSYGYFFLICEVLSVELFKYVLHLLVGLDLCYTCFAKLA